MNSLGYSDWDFLLLSLLKSTFYLKFIGKDVRKEGFNFLANPAKHQFLFYISLWNIFWSMSVKKMIHGVIDSIKTSASIVLKCYSNEEVVDSSLTCLPDVFFQFYVSSSQIGRLYDKSQVGKGS